MATRAGVRDAQCASKASFDVAKIRNDFPALSIDARGKPLVYLDNAATSQKPRSVIDALSTYYERQNANVHRGVHYLSELATSLYEAAREKACTFLNAPAKEEIVFVRGATEGLNLVAQTHGRRVLEDGDEILITGMEHHSNIVPWQILAEQTGAVLKVAPIDDRGELRIDELEALINGRTKIVSVVHISNSLGTINPVRQICAMAREHGATSIVDGAQAAPHLPVDVRELGCDFYTVSGHKMFGPTGIGLLYGRMELLERMPPYQGGGEMISSVTFEKTEYAPPPAKFEAGTPHISGAVGLGAAIDYLGSLDWGGVMVHEQGLLSYAIEALSEVPGLRFIGTAPCKASVVSFVMDGVHAHDIGTIVDREGVAIRTGHHCTQPVMDRFGLSATARASFAFYNNADDVDRLARALRRVREVFG